MTTAFVTCAKGHYSNY